MELVCTVCKTVWKKCPCVLETGAWIFVNGKELEHYFQTGLVPDYRTELLCFADDPLPTPIPLIHPPVYNFVK